MKKADKTQKGKKPADQGSEKPKAVIELTDQDLEQIQGGQKFQAVPPGLSPVDLASLTRGGDYSSMNLCSHA